MNNDIIAIKQVVIELIVNINKRIDDIIIGYRNEKSVEHGRLQNLLEDMQALAEGIDVIDDYFDGIDLLELNEKLGLLAEAFKNADTALFSDIMEFEVKDLLAYWLDCLSK